jgi:hypothetical protein
MAKHVHKYKRMKVGRKKDYFIYRCFVPGCTHYIAAEHIINRESLCWACNSPFVITYKLIKVKPTCQLCKDKRRSEAKPIENFSLEDVLANIAAKEGEGDA